jgi:hypothetical protein
VFSRFVDLVFGAMEKEKRVGRGEVNKQIC